MGSVIECEFCFNKWTLPKNEASPAALSFLRQGEHDLDTCKFDDAYSAFYKAWEYDNNEPEAFWGLALAEFKIQYIKDTVNNRLQPICHTVTDKNFADNKYYKSALLLATPQQRAEYLKKAKEIDYIKNEFNKFRQSGLDYDCFICVKVSRMDGEQADSSKKSWTDDAYAADSIYDLLKRSGYTPFFSEREIRGRTGADYEAMILYALYTSETMLVVCNNEGYLQTRWVKNEYTRFLRLLNDEEKESDSITIIYNGKPIEKLPGKNGKIQGIDYSRRSADFEIVKFVENHTPLARAKREEEKRKKERENDELKRQLEEQRKMLEELRRAKEERTQPVVPPVTSNSELAAAIVKAQKEAEEAERRAKEEAERKAREEAERRARQEAARREEAERRAREEAERRRYLNQFEIKNGVLIKYRGKDTDVIIPDGVTSISSGAFEKCDSITSISIGGGVTSIGHKAFIDCKSLKSVYITDIAKWCSIKFIDSESNPLYYAHNLYLNNKLVTDLVIPDGVTSIGDWAFAECKSLSSITIPKSVKSIGNHAFTYCSSLTRIMIPDSVKSIGEEAFYRCSSLKSVTIGSGVTSIGRAMFWDCSSLKSVTIADSVASIGSRMFHGCVALESVTIPDSVTSIGDSAFLGCSSLKSIIIPDSVTSIDWWAFHGCSALKSVIIPDSVTSIDNGAFYGCSALESVTIPDSVTSIGWEAFLHCDNLTIKCEARKRPKGWNKDWDVKKGGLFKKRHKVIWGAK